MGDIKERELCRPRWMDLADPQERQNAHILDGLGFCGHYLHVHGGGRSGRAPILCTLRKAGGAMPQRELASRFELKAGSLSEVLAKAEEAGLIERTRDPQDRRQLIVSLTEEGSRQADEDQRAREEFRREAFACLSPAERDQLEDMLVRINQHWRSLDD
ncbi:MarR family winged helix-turn-helix transcriptional regulator [Olsenella uli]|uniref:MarR family winged helix-turn-helix transcriptional regulator n=1 Tax=Olsenella uli TaxID=133926 RepID=UPI0012AC2BA2|nr:MarR family transcriptional regulator [Olsenella uli]